MTFELINCINKERAENTLFAGSACREITLEITNYELSDINMVKVRYWGAGNHAIAFQNQVVGAS